MATIALFPSVLGARPGLTEATDMLRSHGHVVHLLDHTEGRVFDGYDEAMARVEQIGFPALMRWATGAVGSIGGPLVPMGFSLGAGMAELVATTRAEVPGVVLVAGALDPAALGVSWPAGLPGQVHLTVEDPWREQEHLDALLVAAGEAGGHVEAFDYPGAGHLFADPSMPAEYQPAEAALFWSRVLEFLSHLGRRA